MKPLQQWAKRYADGVIEVPCGMCDEPMLFDGTEEDVHVAIYETGKLKRFELICWGCYKDGCDDDD
jgi:hypothetical protein